MEPDVSAADDDRSLLARHVAGDRTAFGELVRRHRDRLWAVAVRTLGDPEEAADAVQEALLAAHRAAGRFRGEASVTTWLHRIVINACIDRIRRARPIVPLETAPLASLTGPDPYAARDLSLDVQAALATLPVEQRMAVVLVDALGYPVEEAAQLLSVPVGTVKSRCARGRARLAGRLRDPERNRRPTGAVSSGEHPPEKDGRPT